MEGKVERYGVTSVKVDAVYDTKALTNSLSQAFFFLF